MGIAIHNELLLSTTFHLVRYAPSPARHAGSARRRNSEINPVCLAPRFTFPSLHPDWMLLLSFTHTHVTITVTLALLFIPKVTQSDERRETAAENSFLRFQS